MKALRTISRLGPVTGAAAVVVSFLAPVATDPSASAVPSPSAVQRIEAAPRLPVGARATGAVPATSAVTGAVVLKPRDNASLTAFIAAVSTKTSPLYHRYLSPGAFAGRFGPSAATIATVRRTLTADGLRVTSVARDGLLVSFAGPAHSVEAAFHTGLTGYRLADGSSGRATTAGVEVPASIAPAVSSVVGLNDLVHEQPAGIVRAPSSGAPSYPKAKAPHFSHPAGAPKACPHATKAAQVFGGLTDDQIANAYGAFGLYKQGDTGVGQHIAVFELEPFALSDLQAFDTCFFGSTAASAMIGRVHQIAVDGGEPAGPGSGESILDVEDVSAVAPGADIDVYTAPNDTFGSLDEYSAIVNNDVDDIVTSSWALCEQALELSEPGIQEAENYLFEQAAAQGQSVFSSAGDTGDDSCNEFRAVVPPPGQNPLSQLDPASQPYVVSVGGTTIDDASNPPAEHVWNDGAAWGSGGGGISQSWTMPAWQRDAAVPGIVGPSSSDYAAANGVEQAFGFAPGFCQGTVAGASAATPCRTVPDVSAQADEFTGAVTIFSSLFVGPFSVDGWITIGGTSSSSPLWAAFLALVNASSTCAANPATADGVGFVSPLLYAVASNPATDAASFNDVTTGNNDIYGLANGAVFPATAGYDLATGLGTPRLTGANGSAGLAAYLCAAPTAATARPSVTGLSPAFLPLSGGAVTITGTGFESGTTPEVAGIEVGDAQLAASSFTVTSPTTITATFPAADTTVAPGAPAPQDGSGPAAVIVTLTDSESSPPGPLSTMQYVDETSTNPVPSVTGLSPYGGSQTQATPVTILGSGFTGATTVTFGGVKASGFTVVSNNEITVTPPAYGTETCAPSVPGQSPSTDVCQVQVQVTNAKGSSTNGDILPPYEGPVLVPTTMAVPAVPAGCGCEEMPAPTEYDYVPAPTVTSVSTSAGPASYADEFGGTVITVTGTGFDPLTLDWANFGPPDQAFSINPCINPICLYLTGTEMQIMAPPVVAPDGSPSVETMTLPFSVKSIAGQANSLPVTYAGVPTVTSVTTASGLPGAVDTGGTALTLGGSGFSDAAGPIVFEDNLTPYSLGTQYTYAVTSDTSLSTETVQQNPALVDVEVCTATGCSFNPPDDLLIVFPPGNPQVTAVKPKSGPAAGGTAVVIRGQNLGCVTGVFFGSVAAATFSNEQAILDCGSTTRIDVTAPPGTAGTKVPVTVTTVESAVTGGQPTTTASFKYK